MTALLLFALFEMASAQAVLKPNTEDYKVGEVLWKRPVQVEYVIENTGDKPLVMSYVEPGCDCTSVDWTKTPIEAGEKGYVHVTYDADMLGTFDKEVAIYNNSEKNLVYLYFTGKVVEKLTDYSQSHPYEYGKIRSSVNEIVFPDVEKGAVAEAHLSLVNGTDKPYEVTLMQVPSYVDVLITPAIIGEDELSDVTLRINTDKVAMYGLTQSQVYVSRFVGDMVGPENEIPLSFTVLPNTSGLDAAQMALAPKFAISSTSLDLSDMLRQKGKASAKLTVTNDSGTPLEIVRFQTIGKGLSVSMDNRVKPGKKSTLKISAALADLEKDADHVQILLITNDPKNAKVLIDVRTR